MTLSFRCHNGGATTVDNRCSHEGRRKKRKDENDKDPNCGLSFRCHGGGATGGGGATTVGNRCSHAGEGRRKKRKGENDKDPNCSRDDGGGQKKKLEEEEEGENDEAEKPEEEEASDTVNVLETACEYLPRDPEIWIGLAKAEEKNNNFSAVAHIIGTLFNNLKTGNAFDMEMLILEAEEAAKSGFPKTCKEIVGLIQTSQKKT